MINYCSFSCGIPDTRTEFLYITGSKEYNSINSKQVTQYGPGGFRADLPKLLTGRGYHACAGYYDGDHYVLLVAGGTDNHESNFFFCLSNSILNDPNN